MIRKISNFRSNSQSRDHCSISLMIGLEQRSSYLLALLGGNTSPSGEDLKKILGSVATDADEVRIELLFSEVKGKDITEFIASGREKVASVPSAGGVAVVAAASGGCAHVAAASAEPKKEEKVEEKEESDDFDYGFEKKLSIEKEEDDVKQGSSLRII
ncbi:hypothetical protein L1887_42141 [Cichorium endivia]|nr:hypothetical protein L1887_42141 [Cichorium endivia]